MPSIKLADAMIVWTPNDLDIEDIAEFSPPGSIAVVHGPDDLDAYRRFPGRRGACDAEWRAADDDWRLQALADLVMELIQDDDMRPAHVSEALRVIEGIERLRHYRGRSTLECWIAARPKPLPEGEPSDEAVRAMDPEQLFLFLLDQAEREWREAP